MKKFGWFVALTAVGVGTYFFLKYRKPAGARRCPCGTKGDLNGDGWVSQKDIVLLEKAILGIITLTPAQLFAADLRGDGSLDMGLVTLMMAYLEGLVETFPVCSL